MKLSEMFGRTPKTAILELFFKYPTAEFYLRELAKKAGLSVGAAFKHAKELAKSGILLKTQRGKLDFYKLDRASIIVKNAKRLRTIASGAVQDFIKRLGQAGAEKVILFGSAARGEDVEKSDIDVLIVGRPTNIDVEKILISGKYKVKFAPAIRTPEQYLDIQKREPALWRQVERDGVVLYGI